ncbi:MAG: type II secretion system F family protein [Hyphomicrobium sp.]
MERAGLPADPQAFYVASAISGLLCAAIAYFSLPKGQLLTTLTVVAGFVGVIGLPRFILNKLFERRQKRFIAGLANSIDIIVRGVKSGLPLNECLNIIANEASDPIGPEFKEVVEQQRLGVPLGEALTRLSVRMPLQEVRFLAIVISIQQQSGGNLAEALNNLSTVLRDRHKMAMKIKALSSEAKASALILGSLPPGVTAMLHLSAPEYILPLFNTHSGNLFLGAGLFWMGIGIFVMRKMINFKY